MCCMFQNLPIICLVYKQQLLKGTVSFEYKSCCIHSKNRKVIATGSSLGKLYRLDCEVQQPSTEKATIAETSMIDLWHQRLAHVNLKQLRQLVECSDGIDIKSQVFVKFVCRASAINNHTIP